MDRLASEVAEALGGAAFVAADRAPVRRLGDRASDEDGIDRAAAARSPGLRVATGRLRAASTASGAPTRRRCSPGAWRRSAARSRLHELQTVRSTRLLTQDIEEARRFVRHELGPL